jgi:branched-chain amino acid transport system ATP-binding protein
LLRLLDIDAHYGKVHVLRKVTLHVRDGEIACLIGANGAGKSTLLKVISGFVPYTSGTLTYQGVRLSDMRAERLVAVGIVRVPEGRKLFPSMTVLENLELGAYHRKDASKVTEDIEAVCGIFPVLRERKRQMAGTLSGGEQQMLAMARGLMAEPKLFLLDEPSLGLAPLLVMEIARVVKEINRGGTTILLVEQNANVALKIAHSAYVMESGTIVLEGPACELMNNPHVQRAYLGG